ncbi:molybdate ABC transporter substrate-binding protein [Deinococcus lacus]|uniref:Molybdate ABC transporter substrate-binding protein n=1 Tax=Deinococcus lacus TaxID=392561 RepID=A0ABW1YHG2_9DEIO
MRRTLSLTYCLTLGLALVGTAQAAEIRVFAAASLTDAFTELGRTFSAKTGHKVTFQFAGSQVLRTQLERGARADVYAGASLAQFTPLERARLVSPGRFFASNHLVAAVPAASPLRSLNDLTRPGVNIVIAARNVPAGEYTQRMLEQLGTSGAYGPTFPARFMKNVVSQESNVRQAALKVQLGQADAAIIYASDLTPSLRRQVRALPIPAQFSQNVRYVLAPVRGSKQPQAAQAFADFTLSAQGQSILRKWGFGAP